MPSSSSVVPIAAQNVTLPGWRAHLNLAFERRATRTVMVRCEHEGPLRVQRALYPEAEGVCHAIVVHPPAGIVGGDLLTLNAFVGDGAHVLLTTPGAGKWYRSAGAEAVLEQVLELGDGSVCEWLPQESLVYSGALGQQRLSVKLGADACFIGSDMLCLGRTASGERFEHGQFRSSVRLETATQVLWLERGCLRGGDPLLASPVGLGNWPVVGTLLIASDQCNADLLAKCRTLAVPEGGGEGGVTLLPGLMVARWMGEHAEIGRQWFERLWAAIRQPLTGQPWQRPRIWNT